VAATPAAVLLDQLAAARRRGEPFERAWPLARDAALATVEAPWESREWSEVLAETSSSWRASYERWPAPSREQALRLIREPRADSLARAA